MIRFDRNGMRKYFEGFDYIEYKYKSLLSGVNNEHDPMSDEIVDMFKKDFVRFERAKNHNLYEKIDYGEIYRKLRLIYDDFDEAESFVFLYDFSLGQLIDRYINIPSLDKLFSHHYFEYEWEQHVDMNFRKNQQSFYRDHFVHQIRNCYMIMSYLDFSEGDTCSYYEKVEKTLKLRTNSVSQYACAQVDQYVNAVKTKILSDKQNYDKTGLEYPENNCGGTDEEKKEDKIERITKLMAKNAEGFAWNYLIRGCLIVAALFHDIGYPIRYTYKSTEAVSDYISLVIPSDNVGFDKLNDILENSLLFKTVKKEELRERYADLDHGALSAYILLLQFYESGAIRELDPIKKAMIELAAVVIYDHTLKYESLGDKKHGEPSVREKPSFKDNPLSFTLRFVDDIQEWDRLYFEIEGGDEYLFCTRCKMPIVGVWDGFRMTKKLDRLQSLAGYDEETIDKSDIRKRIPEMEGCLGGEPFADNFSLGYVTSPTQRMIYVCGCDDRVKDSNEFNIPHDAGGEKIKKTACDTLDFHHFATGWIERGSLFQRQIINYTVTCDDVTLMRDGKTDLFYIDYSPYRELYLLFLNRQALRYRIKEVAKLEKQFKNQSGVQIRARAKITENPLMLKARIVCDFLYEAGAYIATGRDCGHNPYKRNMVHCDVFKSFMCSPEERNFTLLSEFVSRLKERGFLAYDYSDEGIGLDSQGGGMTPAKDEKDNFQTYGDTAEFLREILREAVSVMVGRVEDAGDGPWPKFKINLSNTMNCYVSILTDFAFSCSPKGSEAGGCIESTLSKWLNGETAKDGYSVVDGAYFMMNDNKAKSKVKYGDETYERACEIIFRDFMSQLYHLSKDDMEGYYEKREKKPGERGNAVWEDADFVVGANEMEYALNVLFDSRCYNPMIMKSADDLNKVDGVHKFNFFDIHSDMYLFKELAAFTDDNRKRRLSPESQSGV